MSETLIRPRTDGEVTVVPDVPWSTVVWNDPVNLMAYVAFVFRSYFGFAPEKAEELMLRVHNDGRAVVASGGRDEMERHVAAMHGYGLQSSVVRQSA